MANDDDDWTSAIKRPRDTYFGGYDMYERERKRLQREADQMYRDMVYRQKPWDDFYIEKIPYIPFEKRSDEEILAQRARELEAAEKKRKTEEQKAAFEQFVLMLKRVVLLWADHISNFEYAVACLELKPVPEPSKKPKKIETVIPPKYVVEESAPLEWADLLEV